MKAKKERSKRGQGIDIRFRVKGQAYDRAAALGAELGLSVHETFRYLAMKSLESSTALSSLNTLNALILAESQGNKGKTM